MAFPAQHQKHQPGDTDEMNPRPKDHMEDYKAAGKLQGKVALITGGDSGIGRAVAIGYAKEGAKVAILFKEEQERDDAEETARCIREAGQDCLLIAGDVGDEAFCQDAVQQVIDKFGRIDVLVNNAAEQHVCESIEDITSEQMERTFRTNIFGMFYMTKAALPHMPKGAAIINTTSITAYQGHSVLLDYSATKGAIAAFTRSLSGSLAEKGIRVNGVAPGPIWTPLIPSSFDAEKVAKFGENQPLGRAGQPDEVAPCFIFLASADSSYMSGQVLHPNGGEVVGS